MPKLLNNDYLNYYRSRGVPGSILMGNFPVEYESTISRINTEVKGNGIIISPEKQKVFLRKMNKLATPYLAVLAGKTTDSVPAQLALMMGVKAVEKDQHKSFLWHSITGAPRDKYIDDEATSIEVEGTGLLILSNVAVNSTMMKIEKTRDILDKYSYLPRILVISGIDPVTFCKETLHVRPNYYIYFGRNEE